MKILKRVLCLTLSALLLFSLGCLKSSEKPAMTYKNTAFPESSYSYWLSTYKYNFLYNFNSGSDDEDFWDSKVSDNQTYEDYINESILNDIKCRTVALRLFDEYGLQLTEDEIAKIDGDIADKIEYYGSREEINTKLAKMNLNIDLLRDVYIKNAEYDKVNDYLFGDNGINKPTEEELKEYYNDNFVCVKFITIYSGVMLNQDEFGNYEYDEDGKIKYTELTEDEKKLKSELIDTVMTSLEAGANIDECIKEFSDIDYSDSPNGFLISENDVKKYGSDIIKTAFSLETGKCAKVSDDSMTYIVYKCELPEYSALSAQNKEECELQTYCTGKKYKEFFAEYISDVVVNEDVISKYSIRTATKNAYF